MSWDTLLDSIRGENPQWEAIHDLFTLIKTPDAAAFTPTYSSNAGTWAPGTTIARAQVDNLRKRAYLDVIVSAGAVSATSQYLIIGNLPFTVKNLSGYSPQATCWFECDGTSYRGHAYCPFWTNTSTIRIYKDTLANITAANARVFLSGNCEIE